MSILAVLGSSHPSAPGGDDWRCRCQGYGQRCATLRNLPFLRGSFVGQAWASLEISACFPTEPICSIRLIACLDRRALPSGPTVIFPSLHIHLPSSWSSALCFVHRL